MTSNEQLREMLADIEHQRWADWQQWVHSRGEDRGKYDPLVIDAEIVEHWERQIATPYEKLSENEKKSDRKQVDRYWPLILKFVSQATKEAVERERERIIKQIKGIKFDHIKEGKNPDHEKDEYWCCCDCLEDQFKNSTIQEVIDILHPHSKDEK